MNRMTIWRPGIIVAAGLALVATPVAAQSTKPAGVITTLQGTANVQRMVAAAPQISPLKFRDPVQLEDVITTGDQSLARILLGGRAVVTVREHSSLRITDDGKTATVAITKGGVALAVAKERMQPGERIDVRTPNAVAGVRGTVLITEVGEQPGSGAKTSVFTLLSGIVDVSLLNPAGGLTNQGFTLNPLQTVGITGFTPPAPPRNITAAEGQAAANSYKASNKGAPPGTNSGIVDRQVEAATNAAGASGGSDGANGNTLIRTTNNGVPTTPMAVLPPGCGSSCTEKTIVPNGNTGGTTNQCPSCCECTSGGFGGSVSGGSSLRGGGVRGAGPVRSR